jgi:hypothetical protein
MEGKLYVELQPRIRVCVLCWEETWRFKTQSFHSRGLLNCSTLQSSMLALFRHIATIGVLDVCVHIPLSQNLVFVSHFWAEFSCSC